MQKTIIIGNLTKDPELKSISGDKKVCNFSVAVNIGYGDSKSVEYYDCSAWNKSAEIISKYAEKGLKMCLVVDRKTNEKDGKYYYNYFVKEFEFLGSKQDKNNTPNIESNGEEEDDSLPF